MISCDADDLLGLAVCYQCVPAGAQPSVSIYLLCQWANKETGCGFIEPLGPLLTGYDETPNSISLAVQISMTPAPCVVIKYGTTPGGPYPNTAQFLVTDNPMVLTPLNPNTTYYWIGYGSDCGDCLSEPTPEGSGTTSNAPIPPSGYAYVIEDELGQFWELVCDPFGNVGTASHIGPASPDMVLGDGSGGFWKLVTDTLGNRGAEAHPGPATITPVLTAGGNVFYLVVDTFGNIGSVQL